MNRPVRDLPTVLAGIGGGFFVATLVALPRLLTLAAVLLTLAVMLLVQVSRWTETDESRHYFGSDEPADPPRIMAGNPLSRPLGLMVTIALYLCCLLIVAVATGDASSDRLITCILRTPQPSRSMDRFEAFTAGDDQGATPRPAAEARADTETETRRICVPKTAYRVIPSVECIRTACPGGRTPIAQRVCNFTGMTYDGEICECP